jgi:hypothetical protein
MTDPVAQLQDILNNTTGIDQQLNSIQQRTKAVTDPKSYLNDYSTALKLLKQRGSDRVKQLWDEVKTAPLTDDQKKQMVGQRAMTDYNYELSLLGNQFPDLQGAMQQANFNTVSKNTVVGVRPRRKIAVKRRATTRKVAPAPAPRKRKAVKRKTTTKKR